MKKESLYTLLSNSTETAGITEYSFSLANPATLLVITQKHNCVAVDIADIEKITAILKAHRKTTSKRRSDYGWDVSNAPSDTEIREATRIKRIAEAADITRTLNSHKIRFHIYYGKDHIACQITAIENDWKRFTLPQILKDRLRQIADNYYEVILKW